MIYRITINKEISAKRLGTSIAPATHWEIETWNFHPPENPYASIGQVQLYKYQGKWRLWNSSITNAHIKTLGAILEKKRNRKPRR